MENVKMPFLPAETLRTQRVEVYLNDLKERLKELRHQHDEVIQNSVDIIKEIDEVSSSLLLPQTDNDKNESITKIKKLIKEFEAAKETTNPKMCPTTPTTLAIESKVDIRKILENFEKLNESHVLKESLVLFKRAKESFEKIDTFFDKLSNSGEIGGAGGVGGSGGGGININLKHKINMFNAITEMDNPSRYASCCSSVVSLDNFRSTEEIAVVDINGGGGVNNSSENGYEGDNDDSEYDLFAGKKKSKCMPPTV